MRFLRTLRPVSALLLIVTVSCPPAVRGVELRNFEDAALHAVQFWDNREGWAVGDEGAIWHSIDGGQHWERQPSGVRGSLLSLHFLDPYTGWVAGREELPGGGSAGILLYTQDGGIHWRRVLLNTLPGLQRVRFVGAEGGYKTGYLVGDGSDAYPSGVFVTLDGGQNWQPVPGGRSASWLAADFGDDGEGALAGAWNRLATVRRDRVFQLNMDTLGGRNLRDLQLRGPSGLAVGQGGLILRSDRSHGSTWNFVKLDLPWDALAAWDFHAVHGVGAHYWVVGRPGSVALHSPDRGRTWEVVKTGQTLPLNGLYFTDEQHGWAVGEFGTILATTDGGKTWRVQRRGGQQAAVLFLHARSNGLPLDTVAALGGQEGYLCTALRVTASDLATAALARSAEGPRLAAAMRQAGGAAAETLWQFPVSSHLLRAPREDVVRAWDALHGDQAAEQMLRQLVLTIRTWKPSVIITDAAEAQGGLACDGLQVEAAREAFLRAGDPKAFPEQLSRLGLEPWSAAKVYAQGKGGTTAPVTLDLTAVASRLQSTVREFAEGPASLLAETHVSLPDHRDFRLLAARLKDAAGHHDLMEGVDLAPGGLARRMAVETAEPAPELLKAIRQRANLKALAETPPSALTDPNRLLSQVGPMLADMPDDQAAPAAYAIACQYARMGQWNLAVQTFALVLDRYPTHPLAADACRWLIRHNASSEARRRHELGQFLVVQEGQYGLATRGARDAEANPAAGGRALAPSPLTAEGGGARLHPPPQPSPTRGEGAKQHPHQPSSARGEGAKQGGSAAGSPPVKQTGWRKPDVPEVKSSENSQVYLFPTTAQARQWYQSSLILESRLAAFGPLLARDPSVQFCLQAARRNLGDSPTAHKWYSQFVASQPDGPWRSAAAAELWLANRSGQPPRPVLSCRYADTRPLLDGDLTDTCWQVPPVKLQNAAGEAVKKPAGEDPFLKDFATEVRLSHDREFLYLSLKCARPANRAVPLVKPRPRDADLRGHDRVSVLLDLDRDYCTAFHFQVDDRGWVREDCWGDKTWDPRWFVAVRSEPTCWVLEAAIPMTALTGDNILPGKAWACNVIRVVPGRGVQAWSLPAEVPEEALRLEGMGLLLFSHDSRQTAADPRAMPPAR